MKNKSVLFLAQGAIIAALYVALTFVFAPISFREIQVRIAEALTILPVFTPAAIPGLFLGCLLGNIMGGAMLPDVIFGSLATLIGAFFTWKLRKFSPWLAPLPPILSNTLIIPYDRAADSPDDADGLHRRDPFLRRSGHAAVLRAG